MKLLTLAAFVVVGALSGAAGPAGQSAAAAPGVDTAATAPTTDTCFKRRDVHNHTVGGPKTLYLDVSGSGVYRIEMSNSCLAAATSSDPLIFNNQTGAQSVCKPMDLDITVAAAGPSKCIVSSISKLSPAEVAALPKKMRP